MALSLNEFHNLRFKNNVLINDEWQEKDKDIVLAIYTAGPIIGGHVNHNITLAFAVNGLMLFLHHISDFRNNYWRWGGVITS